MSIQKNYNTSTLAVAPPSYKEYENDNEKGLITQTYSPLSQLQVQPIQPNFGPIVIPRK